VRKKSNKTQYFIIILPIFIFLIAEFFLSKKFGKEMKATIGGYTFVYTMHSFDIISDTISKKEIILPKNDSVPQTVIVNRDPIIANQSKREMRNSSPDDIIGWLISMKGWEDVVKKKDSIVDDKDASNETKEEALIQKTKTQNQIDRMQNFIDWLKENDLNSYEVAKKLSENASMKSITSSEVIILKKGIAKYQEK